MATFTVFTENFRSRNRFLSLFLLLWSVINFAVTVRDAKGNTQIELWSAAGFFVMLGALVDVKNILDDTFDGDSVHDDVVLDADNILKNMKYGSSPLAQNLYDHHEDDGK